MITHAMFKGAYYFWCVNQQLYDSKKYFRYIDKPNPPNQRGSIVAPNKIRQK